MHLAAVGIDTNPADLPGLVHFQQPAAQFCVFHPDLPVLVYQYRDLHMGVRGEPGDLGTKSLLLAQRVAGLTGAGRGRRRAQQIPAASVAPASRSAASRKANV
ncbi:hypothetical protein FQZ97_1148430 [compost metagenome]